MIVKNYNGKNIEDISCQYCGKKMKSGTSHLGCGLNMFSYTCECGCFASFIRHTHRKIESIEHKLKYED